MLNLFLLKFLDLKQDQQVYALFEKLSHQKVSLIFGILQHIEPKSLKSSLKSKEGIILIVFGPF